MSAKDIDKDAYSYEPFARTGCAYLSPDEERAMMCKCNDVFVKMIGAKARGWISSVLAPTAKTEALVAEEGFLWYGDYNNIDLPFFVDTGAGMVVAPPHSDFADHRVLRLSTQDFVRRVPGHGRLSLRQRAGRLH